jgi:hypothetical protein
VDGFEVGEFGRSTVIFRRRGERYFGFVEHLHSPVQSVQLDTTQLFRDADCRVPIADDALRERLMDGAKAYFRSRNVVVELIE